MRRTINGLIVNTVSKFKWRAWKLFRAWRTRV